MAVGVAPSAGRTSSTKLLCLFHLICLRAFTSDTTEAAPYLST